MTTATADTGVVLDIDGLLTRWETTDLLQATARELADALVAFERLRARLDAVSTRVVHRFDADGAAVVDGHRSTRTWLTQHAQMSGPMASRRVKVARGLRTLPVVAAAFDAGRLSFEQAAAFVSAVNPRTEEAMRVDEATLVEFASAMRVDDLTRELGVWKHAVDTDGAEPEAGHRSRHVSFSQGLDHQWFGTMEYASADGAVLAAAIDRVASWLGEQDRRGAEPTLQRSPGQLRADALVELVRRGLATFEEGAHAPGACPRPSLSLLVTLEDLESAMSGRTDRGDLVSAAGTERLGCDAEVHPIGWSVEGIPLAHGRTRRLPTAAQRRAVIARDGGCAFPGCDAPAGWAEMHHIAHWGRDRGPTDLENLVAMCAGTHHPLFHEGGWAMEVGPDGHTITIFRPDGSVFDPTPGWG